MSQPLALLLLLSASLGHLVLVRALINRGYELGLPQRLWQVLVALLISTAIAGPILLVRFVGQKGAALLRGGSWRDVHPAWGVYVIACLIALAVGVVVLARRRRLDNEIAAQISSKSEVFDYASAAPLAPVPAGNGVIGRLARLPGNQIFSVEMIEREVRLPRLPREWDRLTILHVTDLHMNGTPQRGFFEWAIERCREHPADVVVMTGDVMDHLGVVDWLPTTLGKLEARLGRYFVLGNHDLHVGGETMRAAMEKIGWQSVAGRVVAVKHCGAPLVLGGTESPWARALPPMNGDVAANEFRVLLSHAPHLIHWARRRRIDLLLAGHLHGGQIQWPIIGPIAGGRFHSGLFDLPPTVMHVGRGLGQMAPIRWGCRPEITRLVLRSRA